MKFIKYILLTIILSSVLSALAFAAAEDELLFTTTTGKEEFARDISSILDRAWAKWQDGVVIEKVYVEGSQGILMPGEMKGPTLTVSSIMTDFDRSGKSQYYIDCVRAVAEAVENGMRKWQKGYSHDNIPFPQGVSCVYTLPECYNVPVPLSTGSSIGIYSMEEDSLYNFMLYRVPYYEENIIIVFKAAAKAVFECFTRWEKVCYIKDIVAEGGVAPQPAPMGPGPGLVKGAKGSGGKLSGENFDGELMYRKMCEYFQEKEANREVLVKQKE